MGTSAGRSTIVVPYVRGMLNPGTYKAVQYSGHWCRFVGLDPGDEGAYGRLFRRLWRSQTDIVLVEHDVVPTAAQLDLICSCGHDWCSYCYDDNLYPDGPMFGCVRFSGRLMVEHPYAADVALVIGKRRDTEAEWWRVDSLVARDLMIRGVEWVRHEPAVHHVHQGAPSGPP
jgi:hypothetical protein